MTNLKLLSFAALLLVGIGGNAQNVTSSVIGTTRHALLLENERKGTEQKEAKQMLNEPTPEMLAEFEGWLQKQMADPIVQQKARTVYNLPVIVHIIHDGTNIGVDQNLPQSQIYSQFDVLNEDFRRLNADTSNTPSVFAGVAADCEINFCKAMVDPMGNVLAEPGIHRIDRNTAGFSMPPYYVTDLENTIKPATIWDPTKYVNIWVCHLGEQVSGYSQFPTGSGLAGLGGTSSGANTDGIVILHTAFGRTGNLLSFLNKGRTTTRQVGTWLGLRHIWGDATCGNDYVDDTPVQYMNQGCPNFPRFSCNNEPNGDMFMNYMDATDDNCLNMFTEGQKARMQTVLSLSPRRASLNASTVCSPIISIEAKTTENVSLYPNPSGGTFSLEMANVSGTTAKVKVFNLQGQAVYQEALHIENGAVTKTFNLSNLVNGTYFVQIESNGIRTNRKVVIAR